MASPSAPPPSAPESTLDTGSIALAALGSVGQAAVLASAGFYLGRKGLVTKEGSKLISTISMKVTIPCLLFSSVLPSVNLSLVGAVWPMLLLPCIFVSTGALLGRLVVAITQPPKSFRKGTIAAVAFGNSTGMPIVLLSVLQTQLSYLKGPSSSRIKNGTLQIHDPIIYLSIYLLTYPIIQWVVGGWLLAPAPKTNKKLTPAGGGADAQSAQDHLAAPMQGVLPPTTVAAHGHNAGPTPSTSDLSAVSSAEQGLPLDAAASAPLLPVPSPDFLMAITDGELSPAIPRNSPAIRPTQHAPRRRRRIRSHEINLRHAADDTATSVDARGAGLLNGRNSPSEWLRERVAPTLTPAPTPAADDGAPLARPLATVVAMPDDDGGAMVEAAGQRIGASVVAAASRVLARAWRVFYVQVLVPPVVGVLCGLVMSSLPPSYYLLCGGSYGERLAPTDSCPAADAPLGFLTRGLQQIGNAAVPLNLILLGNSLSKGPNWTALPLRCNVGIVVAKMLVMPTFAVGLMVLVDRTLGDGGGSFLPLNDPYDEVFYLAAAAVTATPTANNMMVMIEVAGGDKAAMATAIFSQYMLAPALLTVSITAIIRVFMTYG